MTISIINDVLASCGKVIVPDIKNNEDQPDDKGRNKKNKFKNCKKVLCPNLRSKKIDGGFLCERCSPS